MLRLTQPSGKPAPADCVVPNVKRCELCGGTVDRLLNCFQCRDCTAFGDYNTGIMTRLDLEYYEAMFADKPVVVET